MSARLRLATACSALALVAGAMPARASETQTYTYDALGRLVAVQYTGTVNNGQAHSLCHDRADNRTNYKSDSGGALTSCAPSPSPSPSPTPAPTPTPTPSPTPTPIPTPPPSFAISDSWGMEYDTLYFTVTKTGSTSSSFTVNYATADGTATSSYDYYATSGTLTFAPSETSKTIAVTPFNDGTFEATEYFYLNLSGASGGATITDSQGAGTIEDDDEGGGCQFC